MNVDEILRYMSYILAAIGGMAFVVSTITQVIKEWPGLSKLVLWFRHRSCSFLHQLPTPDVLKAPPFLVL